MIRKKWASYAVFGAILLLMAGASIADEVAKPKAHAADDAAMDGKIISYFREKYGIPDTVKLTVDSFPVVEFPGLSGLHNNNQRRQATEKDRPVHYR